MSDDTWKLKLRVLRQNVKNMKWPESSIECERDLAERTAMRGENGALEYVIEEINDMLGLNEEDE